MGGSEAERAPNTPPEALLDAAFRVFAERGYRATRLEEVAAEAGLTKGAIYYHFDGKEDLLRRAMLRRHRSIFEEIERGLAQERAPASVKIRYVLRQLWHHVLEPSWGYAFRLLLGEVGVEFPALFRMWAEVGPVHAWVVIRELIDAGVASGEFRADVDSEVAGRLVVSGLMLQAAFQFHIGVGDLAPCNADRIFDSAVDLFLHGLAVTHVAPSR
jgi:AcrR family transcriptional regulator